MRLAASLVIASIALAAAAVAAASPQYVPSIVTLDGVGEVRPGQSVAQVERSFGVALAPRGVVTGCAQAPFASGAVRGRATFVRGRLGSLWFDRGVLAGRGIAVGSTFTALRRAYRRLEILQDPDVPGRGTPSSGARRLRTGGCASTSRPRAVSRASPSATTRFTAPPAAPEPSAAAHVGQGVSWRDLTHSYQTT